MNREPDRESILNKVFLVSQTPFVIKTDEYYEQGEITHFKSGDVYTVRKKISKSKKGDI